MSEPHRIRPAKLDDVEQIAPLVAELGYPSSVAEVRERLATLLTSTIDMVYVAVDRASQVVGWIEVATRMTLESGRRAEILGLVVASRARRTGVGLALVSAAERWAARQGMTSIAVRSNVARLESHPFYERAGYARKKTQHVYAKSITND